MQKQSGFTVIELIISIIVLVLAGVLFMQQKAEIEVVDRDRQRKTAINAIYYSLEEVYYPKNKFYPTEIKKDILPSVDPSLFTDPDGQVIGKNESDYHYLPVGCQDGKCKSYTLRADLEKEANFVKKSQR